MSPREILMKAALAFILSVLICCCVSCRKAETSNQSASEISAPGIAMLPIGADSVEDFGTGLDLRSISYSSKLSLPPGMALYSDNTFGTIRSIQLKNIKTGESISLGLKAEGISFLSICLHFPNGGEQTLKNAALSYYSTSLGIKLGASVAEVTAKYGKSKPRPYMNMPEAELLEYKNDLGDGSESTLAFIFKKGVLTSIESTYRASDKASNG
jgi:hypothetical protein